MGAADVVVVAPPLRVRGVAGLRVGYFPRWMKDAIAVPDDFECDCC
mgnify:CR=1 FL=1